MNYKKAILRPVLAIGFILILSHTSSCEGPDNDACPIGQCLWQCANCADEKTDASLCIATDKAPIGGYCSCKESGHKLHSWEKIFCSDNE